MSKVSCSCSASPKLVFSCSGASDVGALTDLVARTMTREGCGRMSCLAAIAGGVGSFLETAGRASSILAIDGCPSDCAMKTLQKAGFDDIRHLRLTDIGLLKGSSPASLENIEMVVEHGKSLKD